MGEGPSEDRKCQGEYLGRHSQEGMEIGYKISNIYCMTIIC